ncbi:unnamed protein product [Didymodactylos carnosus]|uniref:Ty3 transposon capsid-like protein domain-containing protein n=1 Tax=Didymodactylos carnosus TaxID=1234261 RepID=A0A8S2R2U7_9BILA|nr:unnamed protein product [Didymodactylos carnosus]
MKLFTHRQPLHCSTTHFGAASSGVIPAISDTTIDDGTLQAQSSSAELSINSKSKLTFGTNTTSINMPPLLSLSSPLNETIHSLNQTSTDLRKAIMENMIKNPKMFSGGKEDVHKWLEDLETQFDTADIPDNNKFSIISYQLKGEALSWFKDNKQNILTWKNFVDEIKSAFTSSFEAELSFKN